MFKNSLIYREILIIVFLCISSFLLFSKYDVLENIVSLSQEYEEYEIDELVSTSMVLVFCLFVFSVRRIFEIKNYLKKIKTLQGILPICMVCGDIRDDTGAESGKGEWMKVDKFVTKKTDAQFSHSYCPNCGQIELDKIKSYGQK